MQKKLQQHYQQIYFLYLVSFALLLTPCALCGQVFSWNSQVTYRADGNVRSIRLFFSLESGLAAGRYIHVKFPFLLGSAATSDLPSYVIREYSSSSNQKSSAASIYQTGEVKNEAGSKDYFFILSSSSNNNYNGRDLAKLSWYTLEVLVQRQVAVGSYADPVYMATTSAFSFGGTADSPTPSAERIIYDWNPAFTQVTVLAIPRYTQLKTSAEYETTNAEKRQGFGQTNVVFFDIEPTVATRSGAVFFVELAPAFQFSSTCISVATAGAVSVDALDDAKYTCAVEQSGGNSNQQSTIDDNNSGNVLRVTRREDVAAGRRFRIKAFVINPYVVASSGYSVYYYEMDGQGEPVGQIIAGVNVSARPLFQTLPITVSAQPFRTLWGFSSQTGGHSFLLKALYSSGVTLPVGAPDDNGCVVYNSVQVFFSVSKNSPSDGTDFSYTVRVRLQSSGVLQGSIRHNLPTSSSAGDVFCQEDRDEVAKRWDIVCQSVGALQAGRSYYVAAKVWFKRNHGFGAGSDEDTDFGRVAIEGVRKVKINALFQYVADDSLFTDASGVTLTANSFVAAGCFAATHSTQGFSLYLGRATQVISVREEESYNGGDPLAALWSKVGPATTGVVTSSAQQGNYNLNNNALIFLVQAAPAQTCGNSANTDFANCANSATNYRYQQVKMELYFNSQTLQFDAGKEQSSGLHLGAFKTSAIIENGALCVHEGQCANYAPDSTLSGRSVKNGIDYNFKELFGSGSSSESAASIDATTSAPAYGRYTFFCGDNAKGSQADVEKCLFDGKLSQTDYENAIIAMRRVRFAPSFLHSSLYADDALALDFVLGFFSGQMDCSGDPCSNAYQFKLASASVLHAYTVTELSPSQSAAFQQSVFAGFVNYWRSNDGQHVPTMLRLRGRLPAAAETPSQADALAVFFDGAVHLLPAQEKPTEGEDTTVKSGKARACACSVFRMSSSSSQSFSQNCEALAGVDNDVADSMEESLVFPAAGVTASLPDAANNNANWRMSSAAVLIKDFAPAVDEFFDVLVPVRTTSRNPVFLTLAFLQKNTASSFSSTSMMMKNSYTVLSVVKLKGAQGGDFITKLQPFTQNVLQLSDAVTKRGKDLSKDTDSFSYGLNSFDIFTKEAVFSASPPDSATPTNLDFSGRVNTVLNGFGAGLTLVAKGVNVFASSTTVQMANSNDGQSVSSTDRTKPCRKLEYRPININNNPRNLKHFAVFCPFDAGVSVLTNTFGVGLPTATDLSISVTADALPIAFYTDNVFSYGLSRDTGLGQALNFEVNKLVKPANPDEQVCQLLQSPQKLSSDNRKPQIFSIPVNLTNPLNIDSESRSGAAVFAIEIAFQPGTNTQWNLDPTFCQLEFYPTKSTCTLSWPPVTKASDPDYPNDSLVFTAKVTFSSQQQQQFPITNVQLQLKLQALSVIDEAYATSKNGGIPFQVRVLTANTANVANWGDFTWLWGDKLLPAKPVVWETCQDLGLVQTGGVAPPVIASFQLAEQVQMQSVQKRVPSTLDLGFSPGASRTVFPRGDYVEIDLAWASEAQPSPFTEWGCLVYNASTGSIAWAFDRVKQSSSRVLQIFAGEDITIPSSSIVDSGITTTSTSYRLHCRHTRVPDPLGSDPVTARWVDAGGSVTVQSASTQIPLETALAAGPSSSFMGISLASKNFSSPGTDASYTFALSFSNTVHITFASIIYVQFSRRLAPRLNSKEGYAECVVDGLDSYCEFSAEGRLAVQLPKELSASAASPQTLSLAISGISQPAANYLSSATDSVWVALALAGDYRAGIDSAGSVAEGDLYAPTGAFPINAVSALPNTVRSKVVHSIWTVLPKAAVLQGGALYVDFFGSSYAKLWLPLCKVIRTEDASAYNWARSCSFLNSKRLRIVLRATDGNSTTNAKEYLIRVSNGPSPVQYHGAGSAKNTIRYEVLLASTDTGRVSERSYLQSDLAQAQFQNSAVLKNMGWSFFDSSGRALQTQWEQGASSQNQVRVNKGYYSTRVVLNSFSVEQVQDRFSKVFTVALTGTAAFRFKLRPAVWTTQLDEPTVSVLVGTSSNTVGGAYLLDAFKSAHGDQTYVPIPPVLTFIVVSRPCAELAVSPVFLLRLQAQDTADKRVIYLPRGAGFHFLRVSFKACIPFKDVVVTGVLPSQSGLKLGPSGDSQTLNTSLHFANPVLLFSVQNIDTTVPLNTPIALSWTVSGTDAPNFLPPPTVYFIVVDDDSTAPPRIQLDATKITVGQGAFSVPVLCDQNATLFYTAALADDVSFVAPPVLGFQVIFSKLQAGLLEQLERDKFDPSWRVFGLQHMPQANAWHTVTVSNVKAGSAYSFEAYCVNGRKQVSAMGSVARVSTSANGGVLSKLHFTFAAASVTLQHKYWLTCALAEQLVVKPYLVVNDAGQYCYMGSLTSNVFVYSSSSQQQQITLTSSSSSDQANPNPSVSSKNPTTASSTTATVYFLRDPALAVADTLHAKLQQAFQLRQQQFKAELYQRLQQLTSDMPQISAISLSAIVLPQTQNSIHAAEAALLNALPDKLRVNLTQLVFSFKKSFAEGFILFGMEKALSGKIPSVRQLFFGLNGNNTLLEFRHAQLLANGSTFNFTFDSLEPYTEYAIYWTVFSEDISPDSENSGLKVKYFLTLPSNVSQFKSYALFQQILGFSEKALFALLLILVLLIKVS